MNNICSYECLGQCYQNQVNYQSYYYLFEIDEISTNRLIFCLWFLLVAFLISNDDLFSSLTFKLELL